MAFVPERQTHVPMGRQHRAYHGGCQSLLMRFGPFCFVLAFSQRLRGGWVGETHEKKGIHTPKGHLQTPLFGGFGRSAFRHRQKIYFQAQPAPEHRDSERRAIRAPPHPTWVMRVNKALLQTWVLFQAKSPWVRWVFDCV